MRRRFELLEHTADLAIRVRGGDLPELFANAAYAMFCQLADLERLTPSMMRQVVVQGWDHESLLVNWLNELLYLHETRGEVYTDFQVEALTPQRLQATVRGVPTAEVRTIIKAATYHGLSITETAEGLEATIVFDV